MTMQRRGHHYWIDRGVFRYEDTGELCPPPGEDTRPCKKCGLPPTPEGHDACLGAIPGATAACCGHGVEPGYVSWVGAGAGLLMHGQFFRIDPGRHERVAIDARGRHSGEPPVDERGAA